MTDSKTALRLACEEGQMNDQFDDFGKDVRVTMEKMPSRREWSWEVRVDGKAVYGYEWDYLNAEGMVQDTLREMGVDA